MLPHAYDSAAAGEATGQIRRVLVVDDSQMQRRILCAMLRQLGFEVWQADSGEAALRLCADLLPDAVLSDWMMPGMDGLDFCRRFRALQRDSYGYFILLTSKSDKGEIARGLDAGADDFLTKPVDAGELRARINAGARILAMQRVLLAPKAAAKRLARTIQRLKAKGEPKPFAGPAESAFLLSPELGALATALPCLVHGKDALDKRHGRDRPEVPGNCTKACAAGIRMKRSS